MSGESTAKAPLLFSFSLLLLPLLSLSSFHPQDNYILTFNSSSSSPSIIIKNNPNSTHTTIPPTSPPHTSTHPFSFLFPISPSLDDDDGPHLLRLHFFPTPTTTPSLFSVAAAGFTLLSNFTPSTPTIKEFFILTSSLQSLHLTFTPTIPFSASINAVELFSAPPGLFGLDGHVLEVLHRVNVGGPRVTPENDTLWRTWAEDGGFLVGGGMKGKVVEFLGRISYPAGGATRETAPESVYGTAREMGVRGNSSSERYNLTWVLPVAHSDHGYLVRLHFCDIVSKALYELYFNVYINGNSACKDLDLSSQSYALASPYYIDFVVESNPNGKIHVSVGPSERSLPSKINAILNGLEILKIHGIATFSEPMKKNHIGVLVGSILGCFALLCVFVICLLILFRWRKKRKQRLESLESHAWTPMYGRLTELTATHSLCSNLNLSFKIPIAEILLATNSFDEKTQVGLGGFGKVYKGVLRDGTAVAVKRAYRERCNSGSRQGLTEFQAEILVLTRIRHRHLVSLIGYCEERSEMILVYEFMANGPLRDHLYGSTKPHLSWKQRLEICIGSARGLHYLHTGTAQGTIIHRDVKSSNILLDENYIAKVGDFGLSRSAGANIDQNHVSTGVKGSFGYLDPEYFRTQQLTDKSDVYSFGVVLLEILCARPVIDRSLSWEEVNLAEWGMKWQKKGHLEKIIDPLLKDEIDSKSLKKFGVTVEKCLAQYGVDRPTMGDVLWNLECVLQLHESAINAEPSAHCSAGPSEYSHFPSSTAATIGGSSEAATSQVFSVDGR